jgi:superfamily II DNA or RNA helicase
MARAQHRKASEFIQKKLFANVCAFADLEQRIAALPDEQSRGAAFEVFAEAYLATQRKHDAAHVWPHSSMPLDILKNLGLTQQDQGVDGVLQTLLGEFNAYQVKFRTGRPSLTWRELSTFIGLADSPRIHSRVLLTNCDELPAVLNDRQGFFCIRGADLDRMEADDFRAIEAWLADTAYTAPKKSPKEHQIEALDVLLPALQTHDRVSAIMACGTGKTLVALWVTERLEAKRVLVLLPSLALLRQTLHEWLHETSLPSLAYLCVCSDPTVKQDLDAIATPQSDLDFPVTTDRRSVREFLDAPFTGAKIIFSTYQSARVVGEALRKGETFDLGIFDEAHKTAGREGRNYALALEDSNLPIRKRLFLTATPRHYNPLRKDKEGDAQLVFSMDKPQVYGEQACRLTFAEAARRGIICNYKVVISVITSGMITDELLSRGDVLVNGDAIRARQVANQLALTDAIAKYGVNKVFTFHRTVKSAESFVADGSEGIGTHLSGVAADVRRLTSKSEAENQNESQNLVTSAATSGFQTFHVNGTMPTALRERVMRDFREASRAVMSNARCLTEGVDVPAVDMVAFLSPRRSRVDIVQATGRAMRRAPGKTTGYVLVPIYLEQAAGESVEAAVSRAEFDEVWGVLQALQDQDEILAEIIREMREERGRTKGFNDARFHDMIVILGPQLELETLRKAIVTACIDNLGVSWDERLGELQAFKKRFGHCDVPKHWIENQNLGNWLTTQRQNRKAGRLSEDRRLKLEKAGVEWDLSPSWDWMFDLLVDYQRRHGTSNVPHTWNPRLASWVHTQRQAKQSGKLSSERIQKLDDVDFTWRLRERLHTSWDEMFSILKKSLLRHGDCNVSLSRIEMKRLNEWAAKQRVAKNHGTLNEERVRRLTEIGFVWNPKEEYWEEMFKALQEFKQTHGNCEVPKRFKDNPKLGHWVVSQRTLRRQGKLSEERVRRLSETGFEWQIRESPAVPARSSKKDEKLEAGLKIHEAKDPPAAWWDTYNAIRPWEEMFKVLSDHKRINGDCNVMSNSSLRRWVEWQRYFRKAGKLNDDMIRRLNEIGFQW